MKIEEFDEIVDKTWSLASDEKKILKSIARVFDETGKRFDYYKSKPGLVQIIEKVQCHQYTLSCLVNSGLINIVFEFPFKVQCNAMLFAIKKANEFNKDNTILKMIVDVNDGTITIWISYIYGNPDSINKDVFVSYLDLINNVGLEVFSTFNNYSAGKIPEIDKYLFVPFYELSIEAFSNKETKKGKAYGMHSLYEILVEEKKEFQIDELATDKESIVH